MKCPDCDSDVKYFHESYKQGGRTRIICSKKCQGWKVIKLIEHEDLNRI